MPKKKLMDRPADPSRRFQEVLRELVHAGELNPTEADAALERVLENVRTGGRVPTQVRFLAKSPRILTFLSHRRLSRRIQNK